MLCKREKHLAQRHQRLAEHSLQRALGEYMPQAAAALLLTWHTHLAISAIGEHMPQAAIALLVEWHVHHASNKSPAT